MRRLILLLLTVLMLPVAAAAQGDARTYVIQKGDTLWGISQRFLKDPFYWPNLWANNPSIPNPHFIYPGQTIRIIDGRIEIVPAAPAAPEPVAASTAQTQPEEPALEPVAAEPPPPPREETLTIHTMGGATAFLSQDEITHAGTIVDTVDNRLMITEGEIVFIKLNDPEAAPGKVYDLIEKVREVEHPITGEAIGVGVAKLGSMELLEIDPQVATGRILHARREIFRGSLLVPYEPPVREIALKKAQRPVSGYVVAADKGMLALSQFDVIHLDIGAEEGIEVGNMLYIARSRTVSEQAIGGDELQLPDVLLGAAVVLETRPHTSSALILKAADTIFRGDRVYTVTE